MPIKELKETLKAKSGYLKKGKQWLADKFDCTIEDVTKALKEVRGGKSDRLEKKVTRVSTKEKFGSFFEKINQSNPEAKFIQDAPVVSKKKIIPYKKGDPNNTLIIGDLHEPWCLDDYLDFNVDLQKKYNVGSVVLIGDIIDGHSWNFHTHDVDGLSVRDELKLAITRLKRWYSAFPEAKITLGGHDVLISRKAKEYGLSQIFIRYLGGILEAPKTWQFVNEIYKDNVYYTHGSFGNAIARAKAMRHSVVQGHLHSQSFVEWSVSEIDAIFGLQVGCGIDRKAYAFEYAKEMVKKPVISAGLILDKGRLPIIEMMKL